VPFASVLSRRARPPPFAKTPPFFLYRPQTFAFVFVSCATTSSSNLLPSPNAAGSPCCSFLRFLPPWMETKSRSAPLLFFFGTDFRVCKDIRPSRVLGRLVFVNLLFLFSLPLLSLVKLTAPVLIFPFTISPQKPSIQFTKLASRLSHVLILSSTLLISLQIAKRILMLQPARATKPPPPPPPGRLRVTFALLLFRRTNTGDPSQSSRSLLVISTLSDSKILHTASRILTILLVGVSFFGSAVSCWTRLFRHLFSSPVDSGDHLSYAFFLSFLSLPRKNCIAYQIFFASVPLISC